MAVALETLGITNEQLIQNVIDNIVDRLEHDFNILSVCEDRAKQAVRDRLEDRIGEIVDARLNTEMTAILSEKISPVDIWGNRTGDETTLRDAMARMAKQFWEVKVDKDGKLSKYGGSPRYEHIMQKLLKDEFSKTVGEHASEVVAGFKAAVKADLSKMCNEHIEKLIPSRR